MPQPLPLALYGIHIFKLLYPFQIAIPATSLLISLSQKNNLVWESLPNIFIFSTDESTFNLVPVDSTKHYGDIVTYGDTFAISNLSRSSFVVLNTHYSDLQLKYDNLENDFKKQEN